MKKCVEYAKKEGLTIAEKPKDFSDFETEKELLKEKQEKDINSKRIFEETKNLYIVKESHSAKIPNNRPKRNKIVKKIMKGEIKGLISYSPDRQARNMIEGGTIIELADQELIDLKYATFHFINNASGRMMLGFWFVFSKQYSDKLSEDITRGNETTSGKGKSLGKYKYGYYRDKGDGFYKPHPKYFKLMKEAFQMKLYSKKSNEYIANRLNANGYLREYKKKKDKVNGKNLGKVRVDKFYYGIFISGSNVVDLRDGDVMLNPFFEPLITEEEHYMLAKRKTKNSEYATPKRRKEKYDEITPISRGKVRTEDGYAMPCYTPNPSRHQKKLIKAQVEKPDLTLKDIVKPNQIRCKCSATQSKFHNFEISYEEIEKEVLKMFSTWTITDKEYQAYIGFIGNRLDDIRLEAMEKNNTIQFEINKIKGERTDYIKKHMHIKDKDNEEERIYNMTIKDFDEQIALLKKDMAQVDDKERNSEKELEIFLKILQKAPQYFKNATYVQKRKIIDLTILNIIITSKKAVKIKVYEGLEDIFDPKFQRSGVFCQHFEHTI